MATPADLAKPRSPAAPAAADTIGEGSDVERRAQDASPGTTGPGARPWRVQLAVVAALLVVSAACWWHVWSGHPARTLPSFQGDVGQELWFLAWLPFALIHGHSPFLSNALWSGAGGLNVPANPSDLLPALLLSPVTLAFGPVAAFNVGALLAPVVSGWSMFLLVRRMTTFVPAQLIATFLWGFSPFMISNLPNGHLDLCLQFFPPLLALVLYDLIVTRRASPTRAGLLLGGLVVVEFFTSPEVLTMTLLTVGLGLAVGGILWWRRALEVLDRLARATAAALAVAVPVLAYPVWFMLRGPRHVAAPIWPPQADAGQAVNAIVNAAGSHSHSSFSTWSGYFGLPGPPQGFLGVPLLLVLAVSFPVLRRSGVAVVGAVVGTLAWLLSLGLSYPLRSTTPVPGWSLWRLFDHVPVLDDVNPSRFSVVVAGAAALLLALAIDRWRARWTGAVPWRPGMPGARPRPARSLRGVLVAVGLTVVGALTLVPIATSYSLPFRTTIKGAAPRWFKQEAKSLPAGTTVLTIPFPEQLFSDQAMAWQAEDGLRFDLAGGYVAVPGGDGRHSTWYSPLGGAVADLYSFSLYTLGRQIPSPWTSAQVAEVRSLVHRWRIGVVVVTKEVFDPPVAVADMTKVLRRPPVQVGRVWLWDLRGASALPQ